MRQRTPMSAREIMLIAQANGLMPDHLHGAAQHKTLHARISVDIAKNREDSRFFRTAPGRFFLRSLIGDPSLPTSYRSEYLASPRKKELRRDLVLAINLDGELHGPGPAGAPISVDALQRYFDAEEFGYHPYATAAKNPKLAIVHSFVVVYRPGAVLSFRSGKFTPQTDPLYGRRSVGVGGTVFISDVDMLFDSLHGVIANGITELTYSIGLPRRLAERARYEGEVRAWGGLLLPSSKSHPQLVHVIMSYRCPPEFSPSKSALSTNDVRWLNIHDLPNDLSDYDQTSRHLLSGRHLETLEDWEFGPPTL